MMAGGAPTHKPQLSQIDSNTAGGSHSSNTQDQVQITQERKETEDFQRDDQIEDVYRDDNIIVKSARNLGSQKNGLSLTSEDLKQIDLSNTLQVTFLTLFFNSLGCQRFS